MSAVPDLGPIMVFYDRPTVPLSLLCAGKAAYAILGAGRIKLIPRGGSDVCASILKTKE